MRKTFIALAAVACMGAFGPAGVSAAPIDSGAILHSLETTSPIQKARVFCYNRYSGRFLHWGSCGRRYYRRVSHPRVYCYNRRNGRFLHWGSCHRW